MNASLTGAETAAPRGRWDTVSVRPVWEWRGGIEMMRDAGGEVFCVQTPGMPLMATRRKGSRVEIGWEGDDGFVLEASGSTKAGEVWKAVPQRPRRWANLNLVVVEAGRGEQYFRLRRRPQVTPPPART